MELWRSLGGVLDVELTSADVPCALRTISASGVPLSDVRTDGLLTARFVVARSQYRTLRKLTRKRGETLRIISRRGVYWNFKRLLERPILTTGMALLIFLMCYMPSRVLFVEVEGNETVADHLILSAAEESGIGFWASRREVRSEKMKNHLLSRVPQLQWAGVNTYGCVAVISVRERAVTDEDDKGSEISSIVASRDGVVLSCTVTQGSGVCTPGQAVREGELLISGYCDLGLCVRGVRAEGEIMAQTRREIRAVTPASCSVRSVSGDAQVKYSLILGKNRINFYKGSGISDGSCVKMYSEYVLTLPGGFSLPVSILKESVLRQPLQDAEAAETAVQRQLGAFAASYMEQQMIAGQILNRDETITMDGGVYCLTGEYACVEMIGRRQREQIGEKNETD